MFKWLKKRRELKRIKAIRDNLNEAVSSLGTIRDFTIINKSLPAIHITDTIVNIYKVIEKIDEEIDDRTRVRESIFQEREIE